MASHIDEPDEAKVPDAPPMLQGLAELYDRALKLVPEPTYHSRMYPRIAYIHDNTRLSDLTIVCNKRCYLVHRIIVSLHSDVLADAWNRWSDEFPGRSKILIINDKSGNDRVQAMLQYMYTNDYDLPWEAYPEERPLGAQAEPAFHLRMAQSAEHLHVKGLVSLATTKFEQTISTPAISLQPFIKLARLAFGCPGTVPTIRKALRTFATSIPGTEIAIYPHDPWPLLNVSIELPSGELKSLDTIHLSLDAESQTHDKLEVFRCVKCHKHQWRDDLTRTNELYTCEVCDHSCKGREWGVGIKNKRKKAKKQDERLGRLYSCPGCDERQMRIDIGDPEVMYQCHYCGSSVDGYAWRGCWVKGREAEEE